MRNIVVIGQVVLILFSCTPKQSVISDVDGILFVLNKNAEELNGEINGITKRIENDLTLQGYKSIAEHQIGPLFESFWLDYRNLEVVLDQLSNDITDIEAKNLMVDWSKMKSIPSEWFPNYIDQARLSWKELRLLLILKKIEEQEKAILTLKGFYSSVSRGENENKWFLTNEGDGAKLNGYTLFTYWTLQYKGQNLPLQNGLYRTHKNKPLQIQEVEVQVANEWGEIRIFDFEKDFE